MQKWFLVVIVILAFLLRVIAIDKYPVGLNPDEASFGYDAYSLLHTGKDQWGYAWPLSLQSFGDYKIPLYTYLAIPSVAVFGLNVFSTRLPNALFGVLAVLVTYLMVIELFKNKKLALTSAFILTISPWHMMLSRGAFEANLTTFFLPFGVWLFLKGLKDTKMMLFSAFVFGLNLFSYHSARLITPLIVLTLIIFYRKNISLKKYFIPVLVFCVFLVIAGWTLLTGGTARGSDVAIFNPTDQGQAIFDRRYQGIVLGLPDQVSRIFSNKFTFVSDEFIKNYITYFSPQFLFTEGPKERTYGMMSGIGVLYSIELLFILTAAWTIIKNREWNKFKLLVVWLLLAPVPAALAKGGGYAANRATTMMPVVQIFSAYGLITLLSYFKVLKHKKTSEFTVGGVLLLSIVFFFENYVYHSPIQSASSMMYGRVQLVEELKKLEPQYQEILVSRSLSEPHIYFAFFNKWDPTDYQNQTPDWQRYKAEGRSFLDQLGEYHLGKYTFTSIDSRMLEKPGILLVGKPNEFSHTANIVHSVKFPNGKDAIWIVSTSGK